MGANVLGYFKSGRTAAFFAGLAACITIAMLAWNVYNEIDDQSSAQTDNLQWSLSQTEVEFQEFNARLRPDTDLDRLRQRFDVFYSRVLTLRRAQVFAELRASDNFDDDLHMLEAFLSETLPLMDVSDIELTRNLPPLAAMAEDVRPVVRSLANSGLRLFSEKADAQRADIKRTMVQLALALMVLISALGLGLLYMNALIQRISLREHEQQQTAARINTIMNTSLDGIIVSDTNSIITNFNAAAEIIFGHKAEDVIGKELGQIIVPPHLRGAHNAGMERMRSRGEKRVVGKGRVQLEAMHADGTIFPVELAIQAAATDEGEIFIAFLRDISRRAANQAELIQARDKAIAGEKSRSEFLATMSHEIRTPLNGLLGNMTLLRDTSLSAKQEAYLHNMDTSGRLLLRHVSDVLDIARYDSGMITAREEPFNVSGLVQDIVDSQSSMALAHNTTLEWGWNGAHQHWIIGDMERLQHVLMNLIGNAVKFTKDGRVTIAAIWGNDRIRFEIEDTGIGVSEDLQEHIFDDFVTGDTSYGREVGGSGLGLSIVKRFVGVLGGKVWVHSVAGIGSTFTVEIPTIPAAPPSEQQATDQILPTPSPQRILVVEDNEINRFVVRSMLEADGHHVTDAMDGQDGVDRAYQEKFDLILMDISMPVLDGRIATQMIREGKGASAHSRIIALTANALPEERADFLTLGMEDVLTKPLSKSALRAALVGHPPKQTIVFDADHLRETREVLGEKNFQKVLSKFHSELDAVQTWPQSDMPLPEIAAQAHKFSGSAALFGASSLVACLQELEATARNGAPPQAMLKISEAATLCASTQQALTAFKAG